MHPTIHLYWHHGLDSMRPCKAARLVDGSRSRTCSNIHEIITAIILLIVVITITKHNDNNISN